MSDAKNSLTLNVYAPSLMNHDERRLAIVHGMERAFPGLQLEESAISAAGGVLAGVAEGAQALWGHITPGNVMLVIAEQMGPKMYGPPKPPRGLPALKLPDAIPAPEIPHCLGWLNYWSAAASQAIGFPDPARDADLLSRARRTATGGWVVQLTDAPLDLDNPAHLDALKWAYGRFPEIGGRAAP